MAKSTAEKLPEIPPHVQEAMGGEDDLAEMKERLEKADGGKEEDELPADVQKMMERDYAITFNFTAANGKVWTGSFVNTVPDVKTRRLIGIMRAELQGSAPWESLDPLTREINLILAHLSWSLESKNPKGHWSENLQELLDYSVLQALYEEVLAHESTFLGPR